VMSLIGIDADTDIAEGVVEGAAETGVDVADVLNVLNGVSDAASNLWYMTRKGAADKLRRGDDDGNQSGVALEELTPLEQYAVESTVKRIQRRYRQHKGITSEPPPYRPQITSGPLSSELGDVEHREAMVERERQIDDLRQQITGGPLSSDLRDVEHREAMVERERQIDERERERERQIDDLRNSVSEVDNSPRVVEGLGNMLANIGLHFGRMQNQEQLANERHVEESQSFPLAWGGKEGVQQVQNKEQLADERDAEESASFSQAHEVSFDSFSLAWSSESSENGDA